MRGAEFITGQIRFYLTDRRNSLSHFTVGTLTVRVRVVGSCPALINAKGIPEQPIEGLVFENIKAPTMEMNLQDVGTLIFK